MTIIKKSREERLQTQEFCFQDSANYLRPHSKCSNLETPLNDQDSGLIVPYNLK